MSIDRLKLMLSFLREISDGNIPAATDYGISEQEFGNIIEAAQDGGLIKGAGFGRDIYEKVQISFLDSVRLTKQGMEYLHENSALMKTYKGLKELRDWLPF